MENPQKHPVTGSTAYDISYVTLRNEFLNEFCSRGLLPRFGSLSITNCTENCTRQN